MKVHTRTSRRGERGMSLAEVMVAAVLALIGFLVALILYQASRDMFKKGEQALDQQQQVRLGFDQMVRDIRLAGFNHNPDGSRLRTDEQIEGAWQGALFLRADYDAEDTTGLATDPEEHIKGLFNIVSTGNDEIVGYMLKRPDGTGGAPISISADVNSSTTASSPTYGTVATRDNVVETISVPNVWSGDPTTQNSPPYTLYRVTLNNSATSYGTGNFIQLTPVTDNVKSLRFRYFNVAGGEITTPPGGDETPSAIAGRKAIARVEVELIGMTPDPDPRYVDPADPLAASQNYRKFSLAADVTPRNLGYFGVPDIDLTAPSTPTGLATCAGHCEGMILTWNPNPPADLVSQYTVQYGTSPSNLTTSRGTFTNWIWLPNLTSVTHYFRIRAEDASGNFSPWTAQVSDLVRDDVVPTLTTPLGVDQATTSVTGSGGSGALNGRIELGWTPVVSNVETIACDPSGPNLLRDLEGYRIYRSTSSSAGPTGTPLVDETVLNATAFVDASVVNCRDYYYYVNAVDRCGHQGAAWSTSTHGRAESNVAPTKPLGVAAVRTGLNAVQLTWDPVTLDTAGNAITIDTYEVFRSVIPNDGLDPATSVYTQIATVTGATLYDDLAAPTDGSGEVPYYKIRAKDDCPNVSDYSDPAAPPLCALSGTITLDPADGSSMAIGAQTVTVSYSGPEILAEGTLKITKVGGSVDFDQTQFGPGPYVFNWTPGQGTGSYSAVATLTDIAGCVSKRSVTYTVVSSVSCCLIIPDPSASMFRPTSGNNKDQLEFIIQNDGSCDGEPVEVTRIVARMDLDQTAACSSEPTQLQNVESPAGTPRFSSGGLALPATADLSPVVTIGSGANAGMLFDYAPSNAIGCRSGGSNLRDRLAADFIFKRVGVIETVTCPSLILNEGFPTP